MLGAILVPVVGGLGVVVPLVRELFPPSGPEMEVAASSSTGGIASEVDVDVVVVVAAAAAAVEDPVPGDPAAAAAAE